MFKKVNCNHCEKSYDETFNECPNCHAPNENLKRKFKRIQMLSIAKQLALFLTGLAGLELLVFLVVLFLSAFDLSSVSNAKFTMIVYAIVYSLLFIILFGIINVDIKKLFKSFKRWQPYVAGICCALAILQFQIIYLTFLQLCGVDFGVNANQDAVNQSVNALPLTSFVILGIIGPICEEVTYRLGLFSFLKRISFWVAYPIATVVFALIHFNFSGANLVNELINLPIYLFAGFALTFTYDRFGFAGSTIGHILNNVISFLPFVVMQGVIH